MEKNIKTGYTFKVEMEIGVNSSSQEEAREKLAEMIKELEFPVSRVKISVNAIDRN